MNLHLCVASSLSDGKTLLPPPSPPSPQSLSYLLGVNILRLPLKKEMRSVTNVIYTRGICH